jgi:hypothetical protein
VANPNNPSIYLGKLFVLDFNFRIMPDKCMWIFTIEELTLMGVVEADQKLFKIDRCDSSIYWIGNLTEVKKTFDAVDAKVGFDLKIKVCSYFIPTWCRTVLTTIGAKTDFFGKEAMQIQPMPTDWDPNTEAGKLGFKLATLPAVDDDGNAFTPVVDSPGIEIQGEDGVEKVFERVLASGNNSIQGPERSLQGTTYSVVYKGATPGAGATSSNFRLVVYDHTGAVISDISYSVPISGTMAV